MTSRFLNVDNRIQYKKLKTCQNKQLMHYKNINVSLSSFFCVNGSQSWQIQCTWDLPQCILYSLKKVFSMFIIVQENTLMVMLNHLINQRNEWFRISKSHQSVLGYSFKE